MKNDHDLIYMMCECGNRKLYVFVDKEEGLVWQCVLDKKIVGSFRLTNVQWEESSHLAHHNHE